MVTIENALADVIGLIDRRKPALAQIRLMGRIVFRHRIHRPFRLRLPGSSSAHHRPPHFKRPVGADSVGDGSLSATGRSATGRGNAVISPHPPIGGMVLFMSTII